MELHQLVNTLGQDLKHRYGERVHKLTLHGGFSCPNRDGTLGRGGCTFCNVASFADEKAQHASVSQQLSQRAKEVDRARRYLAYFQAYTSTYDEVARLKVLYEQALAQEHMVGLCVGTRPDCVPHAVLDLLADYYQQGFEVWLELGLQTGHDKTLKRINRGHNVAVYQQVATKARALGIKVCTHLIVGLPGEEITSHQQTIDTVVNTGTDGIKLHPLHIVEGSTMAKAWRAGRQREISFDDYIASASMMIQRTPPEVVYHRVSASARPPTLLAPAWCENRWLAMTAIAETLTQTGAQGAALGHSFVGR